MPLLRLFDKVQRRRTIQEVSEWLEALGIGTLRLTTWAKKRHHVVIGKFNRPQLENWSLPKETKWVVYCMDCHKVLHYLVYEPRGFTLGKNMREIVELHWKHQEK